MTECPDESVLLGYLAGRLDPDVTEDVEEHLASCAACREVVALCVSEPSVAAVTHVPKRGLLQDDELAERFDLVRHLGAGAFGTVYEAEDRRIGRRVALKVLPGPPTEVPRMLEEAKALGRIKHPNVVAVYEVQPVRTGIVLVMELVPGRTLLQWADQTDASAREIAVMAAQLGRGIAAVHEAGLVHRDIKPSNILIDEGGRPVLVDFGLAQTFDVPGLPRTDLTQPSTTSGRRTLAGRAGTPAYMAPEQLAGEAATPASDQFSLCVALFETLYGIRPYNGDSIEAQRGAIAAGRVARVESSRRVPRWLSRIVRRGLADRPLARFESVDALTEATERGLKQRRRRTTIAAIGAFAGALAWTMHATVQPPECNAELDGIWDQARRDVVERAFMETGSSAAPGAFRSAAKQLDQYVDAWRSSYVEACEDDSRRSEHVAACLHGAKLQLRALGDVLATADEALVERAHRLPAGLTPVERCVTAGLDEVGLPTPEQQAEVDRIRYEVALARALRDAGRYDQALERISPLVPQARAVNYPSLYAAAMLELGSIRSDTSDYDGAEQARLVAFREAIAAGDWDLSAEAALGLMYVATAQARLDSAQTYAEVARGLLERPSVAWGRSMVFRLRSASLASSRGDHELAEAELVAAIEAMEKRGTARPQALAAAHHSLGSALLEQERFDDAQTHFDEARAQLAAEVGDDHPATIKVRHAMVWNLLSQHRYEEAETRARALLEDTHAYPDLESGVRQVLGVVLAEQGKLESAERELTLALEHKERQLGASHVLVGSVRNGLARVLEQQGRYDDALAMLESTIEIQSAALGPDHERVVSARSNRTMVLRKAGRLDEAEASAREVLATVQRVGTEQQRAEAKRALERVLEQRVAAAEREDGA